MFSKCPVSVSAPDTGSGRPWHKLWWWPSSHHSPAHYTRYWQCRGLLLHWNIYPRPDSTKRNWIRSLDFDDIQYPSVINNAGVDGCACDRNGKWMQIFFALVCSFTGGFSCDQRTGADTSPSISQLTPPLTAQLSVGDRTGKTSTGEPS